MLRTNLHLHMFELHVIALIIFFLFARIMSFVTKLGNNRLHFSF